MPRNRTGVTVNHVTDKGVYLLKLPHGTYDVDGVTVNGPTEWQLDKMPVVRQVTTTTVTTHYINENDVTMTPDQYEDAVNALRAKGTLDEYDGWEFNDLDDEYAYRKFLKTWKPVNKSRVTMGDPMPVATAPIKLDTGNKFIKSPNVYGDFKPDEDEGGFFIYTYDRKYAIPAIAREVFAELGMVKSDEKLYYSATEGKKVYYDDGRDSVRFWTAFGTYCFNDSFEVKGRGEITDTLEGCRERYEEDKKKVQTHLKAQFAKHFKLGDEATAVKTLEQVMECMRIVRSCMDEVTPHARTRTQYDIARKNLRKAMKIYEDSMASLV